MIFCYIVHTIILANFILYFISVVSFIIKLFGFKTFKFMYKINIYLVIIFQGKHNDIFDFLICQI
jgi:hypothetical protein